MESIRFLVSSSFHSLQFTDNSIQNRKKSKKLRTIPFSREDVIAIDGGNTYTCMLTKDGLVYVLGTVFRPLVNCSIPQPLFGATVFTSISCNGDHIIALSKDNLVFEMYLLEQRAFVKVRELDNKNIVAVRAGRMHSLALSLSGEVYTWGRSNEWGQLGRNTTIEEEIRRPTKLTLSVTERAEIAAGMYHSAIVTEKGEVYLFGWALYHQLGLGTCENIFTPTLCTSFEGIGLQTMQDYYEKKKYSGVRQVACGLWHTVALTETNEIYTWGYGPAGGLGHGPRYTHIDYPKFVSDLKDDVIIDIDCNTYMTVVKYKTGDIAYVGGKLNSEDAVKWKIDENHDEQLIALGDFHAMLV